MQNFCIGVAALEFICISLERQYQSGKTGDRIFTINSYGVDATPVYENAAAVSGGGGRIAATPDDETVVAGSGVPGLFNEAVNELMCPAS